MSLTPTIVEEEKTLRTVTGGGWDDRVQVAECDKLVRSFLIRSQNYVILHDTMLGPLCGAWLKAWAASLGGGRQLLIYNSHADWDHYWGNQVFSEPILGSSLSPERVRVSSGPQELARKRSEYPDHYAPVVPTPPTILFREGGVIDGGDLTFHFLPTPGHRHDHLSLWIPEIATLFPADSVEDPFPLFDDAGGFQVIEQEKQTLETLLGLKPRWVMPCHAEPEAGDRLIRSNLDYVKNMLARAAEFRGSLPGIQQAFPNPAPEAPTFYAEEHQRALKLAVDFAG